MPQIIRRWRAAGIDQTRRNAPHRATQRQAGSSHGNRVDPLGFERQQHSERHHHQAQQDEDRRRQRTPRPHIRHKHLVAQDAVHQNHRKQGRRQHLPRVGRNIQSRKPVARHRQQSPATGHGDRRNLHAALRRSRSPPPERQNQNARHGQQRPDQTGPPARGIGNHHPLHAGEWREVRERPRRPDQRLDRGQRSHYIGRGDPPLVQTHLAEDCAEVQKRRRGQRQRRQQHHGERRGLDPRPVRQFIANDPRRDTEQKHHQQPRAMNLLGPDEQHRAQAQGFEQRDQQSNVNSHGQHCKRR